MYEANGLPFSVASDAQQPSTATLALAVTLAVVLLGCAVASVCVWRRRRRLDANDSNSVPLNRSRAFDDE